MPVAGGDDRPCINSDCDNTYGAEVYVITVSRGSSDVGTSTSIK